MCASQITGSVVVVVVGWLVGGGVEDVDGPASEAEEEAVLWCIVVAMTALLPCGWGCKVKESINQAIVLVWTNQQGRTHTSNGGGSIGHVGWKSKRQSNLDEAIG